MAEGTPPSSPRAAGTSVGKGRRTILLIGALAIAPVVASYVVYYFFPRDQRVNYGTLLTTAPAPPIEGTRVDGTPFRLDELRGRWVLAASGPGDCNAACEHQLYATRQARTMQGKDQDRIVRAWFVVGDASPPESLLAQHPGLLVVRVAETALKPFPGGAGPIYLIDPLGNLVLRYPEDPDIRGIANDLGRLLRASRIG